MKNSLTSEEFEILETYFSKPEKFTKIHDPSFWRPFKNGLYLSEPDPITYKRFFHLPISNYPHPIPEIEISSIFDFEEEDNKPKQKIIEITQPLDNDQFVHSATYIYEKVYVSLNEQHAVSSLKKHIDSSHKLFLLKEIPYAKHKVKPYNLVNPEVYIGDVFFKEFKIYWMMRFVGENLHDFLSINSNLPLRLIDDLIHGLLLKVQSLHSKSIIHTDIKPENICIQFNSRGLPCINLVEMDDSIIRHHNEHQKDTLSGTFRFYAPEMFINIPSEVQELSSFLAFQELAFHVLNKTATTEHVSKISACGKKPSSLCLFPNFYDFNEENTNIHELSPQNFFEAFINENFNEIFGIETDLFALGCTLHFILNFLPDPKMSRHYATMEELLSHDPKARNLYI